MHVQIKPNPYNNNNNNCRHFANYVSYFANKFAKFAIQLKQLIRLEINLN